MSCHPRWDLHSLIVLKMAILFFLTLKILNNIVSGLALGKGRALSCVRIQYRKQKPLQKFQMEGDLILRIRDTRVKGLPPDR